MLALGVHPQVEVEIALSRAYNRWLCERVLAHEQRLVSMLYLPFNDPDATYRVRQGVRRQEGRGRLSDHLDALPPGARQPVHEDLRAARGDGAADRLPRLLPLARPGAGHAQPLHLGACARLRLVQHVHLANWIINGIPERFPKLKVVWLESGLAWIPFMMQRFDNEYMMRTSEAPALKKLPSDYMRDMYLRLAADGGHRHGPAEGDHARDQCGDAARSIRPTIRTGISTCRRRSTTCRS